MKPGETQFTGDTARLAVAARQYEARERIGMEAGVFFAHAAAYLEGISIDGYATEFRTLHSMNLGGLLSWHNADELFIDGTKSAVKPFSASPEYTFVDAKGIAVSRPYDMFTEETTGVQFICGALVGTSHDGLLSALIVATARPLTVPAETPLSEQDLIRSVPLALVRQDNMSGTVVLRVDSQEPRGDGHATVHLSSLNLDDTEGFVITELPRLMSAMPVVHT